MVAWRLVEENDKNKKSSMGAGERTNEIREGRDADKKTNVGNNENKKKKRTDTHNGNIPAEAEVSRSEEERWRLGCRSTWNTKTASGTIVKSSRSRTQITTIIKRSRSRFHGKDTSQSTAHGSH